MIPEPVRGPVLVAEVSQDAEALTTWDGIEVKTIPGVHVRVEYLPGASAAALAVLDAAVQLVKTQIVDDERDDVTCE